MGELELRKVAVCELSWGRLRVNTLTKTLLVTSWCGSCATRGAYGEEYLQKTSSDGLMEGGRRK